ncbi:MAG: hypothetical protein KME04_13065 [Pleurocapsa minor GSE-CHR-MK-17-07R]|nr:hypothetical protein [Pleurocapsa minor GSE-CHR-MK 17-07R]
MAHGVATQGEVLHASGGVSADFFFLGPDPPDFLPLVGSFGPDPLLPDVGCDALGGFELGG